MSGLETLPPLRDVIRAHGLSARKGLGQNFLLDLNLTRKIARAGKAQGASVIEVGPGPGGLTRALLLEGAERVIAIEKDRRCLPALEEIAEAAGGRLDIVEEDALKANWEALAEGAAKPLRVIANLPYNIATPLLTGWLEQPAWPPWWTSLTLMFQKEVAERITAKPGGKAYGRLGVLANWRAETALLFDVPPRAFTPPPKVTSSVVSLLPRERPLAKADVDALRTVAAAAFGQRRKMLRVSLKSLFRDPNAALEAAGLAGSARPETLAIEDFARLACLYAQEQERR